MIFQSGTNQTETTGTKRTDKIPGIPEVAQIEPISVAQFEPLGLSMLPKSGTNQTEMPGTKPPKSLAQLVRNSQMPRGSYS